MKVTVAIPTCNRAQSLQRLLDALSIQTYAPDEVVIIDASDGLSSITNPGLWNFVHIAATEGNLPLQRWQAVLRSQGEIIVFFDDDTAPMPTYLEKIVDIYQTDTDHIVGGVGGWLIHNSSNSHLNSKWDTIRLKLSGAKGRNDGKVYYGGFVKWGDNPPENEELDVPCLSGGAMSFRTAVLKEVGPQPWLYELYRQKTGRAEDAILSSLVRRAGNKLILLPKNTVVHYTGEVGSAYARIGYGKGLADTWSRYLSCRLLSTHWNLLDWMAYLRYTSILIAFNVIRGRDIHYIGGALIGISKCFFSKLPFNISTHHG